MFYWDCYLVANIGTSSCMHFMILMSTLLMYSLKFLEIEELLLLLSLVIGWLPPNSEASTLMFSSFDTTLSFFINDELALFFFKPVLTAWEIVCYPNNIGACFQL